MDTDTGPADYMLFIDGEACGIIEAKREGADLGGVAEQSQRYATSTLKHIQRAAANDQPLLFFTKPPIMKSGFVMNVIQIHAHVISSTFTNPKH